jgi:hypothetical protein
MGGSGDSLSASQVRMELLELTGGSISGSCGLPPKTVAKAMSDLLLNQYELIEIKEGYQGLTRILPWTRNWTPGPSSVSHLLAQPFAIVQQRAFWH